MAFCWMVMVSLHSIRAPWVWWQVTSPPARIPGLCFYQNSAFYRDGAVALDASGVDDALDDDTLFFHQRPGLLERRFFYDRGM